MISLKVVDVRDFMSKILVQSVFDNFLLSEATIHTGTELYLSGKLNEDFFSTEELEELKGRKYATWAEKKAIPYSFIKGNKLPLSIKIVFLLSEQNLEQILQKSQLSLSTGDINGLFLNIRYDKNGLYIITGTSLKIFTMDKTLEQVWDSNVKTFLKHFEIAAEEV